MIQKYKHLPTIVEAFHFTKLFEAESIITWLKSNGAKCSQIGSRLFIHLEADMLTVNLDDYVVKGIDNQFYPCKKEIFEHSYERVM